MTEKISITRALYGFDSDLAPFVGKTPAESASLIKSWGCDAVFLKKESEKVFSELKEAGIRRYRSFAFSQGCGYWKEHPESRPVQADGTPLQQEEWYCGLCPNQDWLREEKLAQLKEIISSGHYDGIWLDFIRYPVHWESPNPNIPQTCFCPTCLKKFSEASQVKLPEGKSVKETAQWILSNHAEEWYPWRAEQITELVRQCKELIDRQQPGMKLGLFGLPWFRGEREDAVFKVAGQDFASLAESVDIFSPMVYHIMCGEPPAWVHDCTVKMQKETGKPVWPIIQGCSVPDELTEAEFIQTIHEAELPPAQGIIIFGLNHLVKESRIESLKSVWHP